MSPLRLYSILLLTLAVISCASLDPAYRYKAPLIDQGEAIIYLQPMPQEANPLRFTISGIFAVPAEGDAIELRPSFDEISGADLTGMQKHLAAGVLPPGAYTGLALQIQKAVVMTREGEVALFVPPQPVVVDHAFNITRQSARALFLSFDASKFITDEVRFTPGFSLAAPGRVLTNLTGLVTNSDANSISVFNKKTMQIVDVIATGQGPQGIVLDQVRARAYVAVARDDAVEVYDIFKGSRIGRIRLNFKDRPIELALAPDRRTLLAVNHGSNTVSVIDARAMFEVTRIGVGEGPTSAVVDPAGLRAYVFNSRSSTISVIDLTQRGIALTIAVEGAPLRGAFNRRGDKLFVISSASPNLTVIDLARLTVAKTIFIGLGAVSITVDPQWDQIFVGKQIGQEIVVIDPFSLALVDTIAVGGNPAYLAIDSQERSLFAALSDRRTLRKINLTSKKFIAEAEVDQGAFAVAVMGER
jgi:YVTN family beta-propeller protein